MSLGNYPAVPYFKDEDAVVPSTMNRPVQALAARTDYLASKMEALAGSDVMASLQQNNVAVAAGVEDNRVVYLDSVDEEYKLALASSLQSNIYTYNNSSPSTYAVGMYKGNDIVVTYGRYEFTDASDIPLEPTEVFQPGPYYLSNAFAGLITQTPKGPAVYIGTIVPDGTSFILNMAPQVKDLWEAHLHKQHYLSTAAVGSDNTAFTGYGACGLVLAGFYASDPAEYVFTLAGGFMTVTKSGSIVFASTEITINTRYALTDGSGVEFYITTLTDAESVLTLPDAGVGWREATGDDMRTTGYVYNTGYDTVLSELFPDTPVNGFALELNGVSQDNVRDISTGAYATELDGLYWLSTVSPLEASGDMQDSKVFKLYTTYTRVGTAGAITSVTAAAGSAIAIKDGYGNLIQGQPQTGDVVITGSFDITEGTDITKPGYVVVKGVDSEGNLERGPVVETIAAGSGLIASNVPGTGVWDISLDEGDSSYRGSFKDVMLNNARQELDPTGMIPYLSLRPYTNAATDPTTSILASMEVGRHLPEGEYDIAVYVTAFPTVDNDSGAIVYVPMTMKSAIVKTKSETLRIDDAVHATHAPAALTFAAGYRAFNPKLYYTAAGTTEAADAVDNGVILTTDADYLEPGDTFTISIGRAASASYTGSIGLLGLTWELIKRTS